MANDLQRLLLFFTLIYAKWLATRVKGDKTVSAHQHQATWFSAQCFYWACALSTSETSTWELFCGSIVTAKAIIINFGLLPASTNITSDIYCQRQVWSAIVLSMSIYGMALSEYCMTVLVPSIHVWQGKMYFTFSACLTPPTAHLRPYTDFSSCFIRRRFMINKAWIIGWLFFDSKIETYYPKRLHSRPVHRQKIPCIDIEYFVAKITKCS